MLHVQFEDEELLDLKLLLDRALNTWDLAPKWAWALEAKVVARINDIKMSKEKQDGRT